MIKRTIHQENETIANICKYSNITLKYIKQKFINFQVEIEKPIIMVRDDNILFSQYQIKQTKKSPKM
jgi:hypothetical protein